MKHIAIFASGNGSNAENIARTFASGNRIRVAVVLTNNANAGVKARMEPLDIPVIYFPNEVWSREPQKIVEALVPYNIDLVALAGFMRKVQDPIVEAYNGRMLNIHPSLIPAYCGKGMFGHHVHEAVVAAGEKQSGVTVHQVTTEIDAGSIVMQGIVELAEGETAESLEAKIHEIEYQLYPRAIVKALQDIDAETSHEPGLSTLSNDKTADEQWADALHISYTEQKTSAVPPKMPPIANTAVPPQLKTPTPTPPAFDKFTAPRQCAAPTATAMTAEQPAGTYLIWCVIFIILFGFIPAVIALAYSLKTRRMNSIRDYDAARHASNMCQGWLIASFCIGVLIATMYFPLIFAVSFL